MSSYLILFLICIIIIIGLFNKVNCFDCFYLGAKEGVKTSVNMFSSLLVFLVSLSFLISSGLIEFISDIFNFEYSFIIVQLITRPLSSSSSMSILITVYDTYGVDSSIGLISTMIHYVSDATLYIVPFYCSLNNIKKYDKIIVLGLLLNIISYLVSIILIILFLNLF